MNREMSQRKEDVYHTDDAPDNPSRRRFLKEIIAGAAMVSMPRELRVAERAICERSPEELQLERLKREVCDRYGITVSFADTPEIVRSLSYNYWNGICVDAQTNGIDHAIDLVKKNSHFSDEQLHTLRGTLQQYLDAHSDKDRYDIVRMMVNDDAPDISQYRDTALDAKEKLDILQRLYRQLQLYPDDLLQTLSAHRLNIVLSGARRGFIDSIKNIFGTLRENEFLHDHMSNNVVGMYTETKNIEQQPRFDFNTVFLMGGTPIEKAIHHEIFHRCEDVFNGSPIERNESGNIINSEIHDWRKENKDLDGDDYFDSEKQSVLSKLFGLHGKNFVSHYAQSTPREDRAEVANAFFSRYSETMHLAQKNKALAQKVRTIKDYYWHWSGGIMDDGYWELIANDDYDSARAYVQQQMHARDVRGQATQHMNDGRHAQK